MTGKELQERLAETTNLPFNEIAERLGVSSQSLYQYFLAKDVKSGLIEKICEEFQIDIAEFYGKIALKMCGEEADKILYSDKRIAETALQYIGILQKQLDTKDEQIGKLINLLNK